MAKHYGPGSRLDEETQAEVLEMLQAGASLRYIAAELGVSRDQVRTVARVNGLLPKPVKGEPTPVWEPKVAEVRRARVTVEQMACPHCGGPIGLRGA
jgi:hypothetical protein